MILLIRGLPGSGKTYFAKEYLKEHPDFVHIESDVWFEREVIENGNPRIVYDFIPAELTVAHLRCTILTEYYLKQGRNVIVSNTFTTTAECAPYFVLAIKYNEEIELKTMAGNFQCIHGVPELVVEAMKERFEDDEKVMRIKGNSALFPFYFNSYEAYRFFNEAKAVMHVND